MKYPSYSEYRDDGVSWIGSVPKHWKISSLRRRFRIVNGSTPQASEPLYWDGDITWVTPADFKFSNKGYIDISSKQITLEGLNSCGTSIVPPNSIILTTRAPIGGVAQARKPLCTNQGCKSLVIDAEDIHERFVYYFISASNNQLNALGLGTTFMELPTNELAAYKFPFPTLNEQEKIAEFLDWKTGQIDALIAKKKKLIEKLKEKRLAVITHAVTKGLNPQAVLRDSGTPWLNQVPEHWEVMRFGYRTNIQEGQVDPEQEPYCEMPLIAPNHIESDTGKTFDITSAKEQAAISGKYQVQTGDIVYSKIRPHLNKCTLVNFDGLCSADMYPIRTEQNLTAEFLLYWMLARSFLDYATESSMRVAMPKLNRDTLNAAPLVVPPPLEQTNIVIFIKSQTSRIDDMGEKVVGALERLVEYRSSLITAATTGKIDVRGVEVPASI